MTLRITKLIAFVTHYQCVPWVFQKDDPLCKQLLKRPTEAREETKRINPNLSPKRLALK